MKFSRKLSLALGILRRLRAEAHEAYIVGGFVRDYYISICKGEGDAYLAGADDRDIDISSSCTPDELRALFGEAIDTGVKYGTLSIPAEGFIFEHTTFRKDVEYVEGCRRPQVAYAESYSEDIGRRDFKMNTLAMDVDLSIIDRLGAGADIENELISCVGCAEDRFREDSLRKLRAMRFVAKLGFDLDDEVYNAIKKDSGLKGTSSERIRDELGKIIMGKYAKKALLLMAELSMFDAFMPEMTATVGFVQHSKYHDFTVFEHIVGALTSLEEDESLRLAALLHDIAKPLKFTMSEDGYGHFKGHAALGSEMAREILERLRYPKRVVEEVSTLIARHHSLPENNLPSVRAKLSSWGLEGFRRQIKLSKADNGAKKREPVNLDFLDELLSMAESVAASGCALNLSDLAVTGRDLISVFDIKDEEKPMISGVLKSLLQACLDQPSLNERDELLSLAYKIIEDERRENGL